MAQTVQHRRRLGSVGAPPSLLQGQFALNDPGGTTLPRLYAGGNAGVVTLVSSARQVELVGDQTITGNKTIGVGALHLTGGSAGDTLRTDGLGNLTWVAGNGAFPEAPSDGLIYGRNGQTAAWVAITGASLTINGLGLVAEAPVDGRIYGRANESWVLLPFTGGGSGSAFPEAPADGQLYGRTGLSQSWLPTLPIAGGSMQGNLVLVGPPNSSSPPNQAATKGYVDARITGALQFVGAIDGTTGLVNYTTSSAHVDGPLVAATAAPDQYVICSVAGTVPSGPISGQVLGVGDWVISDGTEWTVIPVGSMAINAADVIVTPEVFGQDNVQSALEFISTNGLGSSWTHTTADFVEPDVGSNVTVTVSDTRWMDTSAPIFILGSTYTVVTVDSFTAATLARIS
jgi:hypothetical protein